MIARLRQVSRGALRRLVSLPLTLSTPRLRAEALTALWDGARVEAQTSGGSITFFAPTPILRSRAMTLLEKEPETIAWIDRLGPDAVMWDIGANIGLFSLYAATNRRCSVLAFEPSAANYAVLARNLQINGLNSLVTAYCLALAGDTSIGVMNLDSSAMGTAMTQFGKPGDKSRYSSNDRPLTHGMVGFTLDEFVERFAPPPPTHIKIDVDGIELAILRGGVRTLSAPSVQSVIVELTLTHREELEQSMAFLESCGLRLKERGSPQGQPSEQGANHIFERA